MTSQKEQIKQYLLTGKTLSPIEALQKFHCFRLGARIWDLRHEGYSIENIGTDEGQYAVYKMRKDKPDDSVDDAYIPTPRDWKCPRLDCTMDVKHTHTTLPPAFDPEPTQNQPSLL